MNKTPSEGLNPFRRGSFAQAPARRRVPLHPSLLAPRSPPTQAAKYSTPIWGAALHGSTAAPRDALLGGDPSTVALSLEQLTLLPPPVATATATSSRAPWRKVRSRVARVCTRCRLPTPRALPSRALMARSRSRPR